MPIPKRIEGATTRVAPGACAKLFLGIAERGLRSRQACDGYSERRATDVVQSDRVAESDRGWVTAMLTTNPDFQIAARLTPFVDTDLHQLTDSGRVDRGEWISP